MYLKRSGVTIAVLLGMTASLFGQTIQLQQRSYTAEFKIVRERTLADDSKSTEEVTEVRAQDAQRRIFISATTVPRDGDSSSITEVMVVDPVAREYFEWSVPGDHAVITMLPTLGELSRRCADKAVGARTADTPREVSRPKMVGLGKEMFMGVEARGSRESKTILVAGSGGMSPVIRTREIWLSVDPLLIVKAIIDDPGTERFTQELVRFDEYEPSPAIFRPPQGYEIVTRPADQAPCPPTLEPPLLKPPPW